MKEDELGSEQERGNYLKRGNLSKIKEILLFPYLFYYFHLTYPKCVSQCDSLEKQNQEHVYVYICMYV